jgi:hypothetical protein
MNRWQGAGVRRDTDGVGPMGWFILALSVVALIAVFGFGAIMTGDPVPAPARSSR